MIYKNNKNIQLTFNLKKKKFLMKIIFWFQNQTKKRIS